MRKWLFSLRKERNFKQQELAALLGIAQSSYSQIENGERQKEVLTLSMAGKIAKIFNISLETVLGYEEGRNEKR